MENAEHIARRDRHRADGERADHRGNEQRRAYPQAGSAAAERRLQRAENGGAHFVLI
jgi:hypothetical protein